MALDEALRDKAKRGQLNHLSLIAHTARDGTVTFRTSYRDTKRDGARHGANVDPVEAIRQVLGVKD